MKEQIYTIPINEAFDLYEGCPVRRLNKSLERASLEYVMGPAMMEPDVRMETNKDGFCFKHYDEMQKMKNRLGLALMLESHIGEILSDMDNITYSKKDIKKPSEKTCYVCRRTALFMSHYYENIIYLWKTEAVFKEKFSKQPYFSYPHYKTLLKYAASILNKKDFIQFRQAINNVNRPYIKKLHEDIALFCKSFDHRFSGIELGDAKNSVIAASLYLTGEEE